MRASIDGYTLAGGCKYTYHLDLNGYCFVAVLQLLGEEHRGANCGVHLDHSVLPWGKKPREMVRQQISYLFT
jgi:hypothetical protein